MIDQRPDIKMQNQVQKPKKELKYRAFYSVTSIGANVVEAKGSSSKREFLKFFEISLKSSQESKYWLAMLKELLPDRKEKIDVFIKENDEITKILSSSILTMKGKRSLKSLI